MKKNFAKFIAQLATVSIIATIGILALCSEPTAEADFLKTFIAQVAIAAVCFTVTYLLGRKWQINRKMTFTGLFQ